MATKSIKKKVNLQNFNFALILMYGQLVALLYQSLATSLEDGVLDDQEREAASQLFRQYFDVEDDLLEFLIEDTFHQLLRNLQIVQRFVQRGKNKLPVPGLQSA